MTRNRLLLQITALSCLLLLTGCGAAEAAPGSEAETVGTDAPASTAETAVPQWAQTAETDGQLFQGLEVHAAGDMVNTENGQTEDLPQVFRRVGGNNRSDDGRSPADTTQS